MGDVGELRKQEAELGEESQELAGHGLDVVLPADHDEARDLVADQHAVAGRDLVLDAVHALGHAVIQRAGGAPADGRRDEDDVGPVHEGLVDLVELVGRVHLGDRAGPGAGGGGLRVVALAGAEAQLAEADHAAFGAEGLLRVREGVGEELLGAGVARVRTVHDRGTEARHPDGAGRADDGPGQRVGLVGLLVAGRPLVRVDEHAAVLDLDRVARDPVLFEAGLALAGAVVELPVVPGADDIVSVQAALSEGAAHVVADSGDRGEGAVAVHEGDGRGSDPDGRDRLLGELFRCADVLPLLLGHRASFAS